MLHLPLLPLFLTKMIFKWRSLILLGSHQRELNMILKLSIDPVQLFMLILSTKMLSIWLQCYILHVPHIMLISLFVQFHLIWIYRHINMILTTLYTWFTNKIIIIIFVSSMLVFILQLIVFFYFMTVPFVRTSWFSRLWMYRVIQIGLTSYLV